MRIMQERKNVAISGHYYVLDSPLFGVQTKCFLGTFLAQKLDFVDVFGASIVSLTRVAFRVSANLEFFTTIVHNAVGKFDKSIIQILREINFRDCRNAK